MAGGAALYTGSLGASTGSTTSAGCAAGTSSTSNTSAASATSTSAASSDSSGGVRRVRLARPAPAPAAGARAGFGFSVRGGREHGTGFFVTHVEPGSEAHNQGLKVGDQVVRVNGFKVGDALHKEMLGLIASLNYLKLKVRNVGMVPVKEKPSDPLTWRMVAESLIYSDSSQRASPPLGRPKEPRDVRLTLMVPSRAKLGCGICKGPDWRPGIFVQFTKECGIAREAGLRPGDQIMQCNGIDFRDIQFSDAVALMKQARRLELWVRVGAGLELFPGESSGYNSSASSATGDQSPSGAEHKRLSIVKEETLDLEDRLSQLDGRYKRRTWEPRNYDWERENSIKESECELSSHHIDHQINTNSYNTLYATINTAEKEKVMIPNCTIINLSEKGTTIQSNYVVSSTDDIYNTHRSTMPISVVDKKTVVVDVHRSDTEHKNFTKENVMSISCQNEVEKHVLRKVPSSNSIASLTNSTGSSLSNAISQEFLKRSERLKNTNFNVDQIEEMRKNKVLRSVDDEKKQKHDALMDEFKKAHKRMFAGAGAASGSNSAGTLPGGETGTNSATRQTGREADQNEETCRSTTTMYAAVDRPFNAYNGTTTTPRVQNIPNKVNATSTNGHTNGLSNGPTNGFTNGLSNGHSNGLSNGLNNGTTNGNLADTPKRNFKPPGQPPPPPPPMPMQDTSSKQDGVIKSPMAHGHMKPKAPPPPPVKKTSLTVASARASERPPSTPTPDYDTSSLIKVTSKPKLGKSKSDAVEMESLESFKLNNGPLPTSPKPPSTYFMKQQNGMLTMKKSNPQVSVTIGEYPTNTFRKQPSKLEFLGADAVDGRKDKEPVGSRLQSELVQTLSRSNLRKKTESDKYAYNGDIQNPFESGAPTDGEPNANFHKRYGHVVLPQAPTINIPKIPLGKSLSHNPTLNGDSNRITILMPPSSNGKHELVKTESLPQNGILKNTGPFINDRSTTIKISPHNKSIKFGQT